MTQEDTTILTTIQVLGRDDKSLLCRIRIAGQEITVHLPDLMEAVERVNAPEGSYDLSIATACFVDGIDPNEDGDEDQ